jgi:hypothetical protein
MGPTQGNRWVAVGRAASTDGFEAGSQAATGALTGSDPRLLLVFVSEALDLGGVLTGIAGRRPGTPVVDVYLDRLNAPPEARIDPEAFTRFAATHPLGLTFRRDEEQVRFVSAADFDDRSLTCIAEVSGGGLAWFMGGSDDSVLAATDAACADALAGLGERQPLGMVAFDCIARRGVLGDREIRAEVERVASHSHGAPVSGFYTYGEIARTHGVTGSHTQTLVVLAVS